MPRWAKLTIALIILTALVTLAVEGLSAWLMTPSCQIGRRILMGRENIQLTREQNAIGQAYLMYICAPNYCYPKDVPKHNAEGYRGKLVPLDRRPGVLRVICLGGSTTYGSTVPLPNQTWPAVLEEILRAKLPQGWSDVEVLNGGLSYGTSAEILTHYHFKYHYYRPDVVIINEGGNDAEGHVRAYYHPDNSNWRFPMINLRPLPPRLRWLAQSRFLSYIMLNVFYVDQLTGSHFVDKDGVIPAAPWFRINGQFVYDGVEIPYDQLAFAHNMETLIQEALFDGARVLLAPFRAAPGVYEVNGKDFELGQILRNEQIFKDFAQKYKVGFAPFPADIISPGNWTDHCHLNVAGEQQKAAHIAPYVLELITTKIQ